MTVKQNTPLCRTVRPTPRPTLTLTPGSPPRLKASVAAAPSPPLSLGWERSPPHSPVVCFLHVEVSHHPRLSPAPMSFLSCPRVHPVFACAGCAGVPGEARMDKRSSGGKTGEEITAVMSSGHARVLPGAMRLKGTHWKVSLGGTRSRLSSEDQVGDNLMTKAQGRDMANGIPGRASSQDGGTKLPLTLNSQVPDSQSHQQNPA